MTSKYTTLVFEDDFNSGIDRSIWGYEIGKIRNNELQYYTDRSENSYTENGCLVIEGIKGEFMGSMYSSASLNTKGKKEFLFGRLEMRAKLPYGQGIWPAFWTLGVSGGWPDGGEIDIMELVGGSGREDYGDNKIHANIHYKNKKPPAPGNTHVLANGKYADDFHIIGIIWDEDKISWYVDDTVYYSADISDIPAFHKPQYILLNLAIGGAWPGDPNDATVFPQKYYIDWVRYYK